MILKGNQRAFGGDLASHLLNLYENDDAELVEIRGSASHDLHGAFAEFEAIATGTRCKEPLYSLSINPSEPMSRKQYFTAINQIEKKLDLNDQPRAIVFHVKNGREHCHVVWSRIDVQKMKAVQLSHDRQKLRAVAREIAQEFGHKLPSGLAKTGRAIALMTNHRRSAQQNGGRQSNPVSRPMTVAQTSQPHIKTLPARRTLSRRWKSAAIFLPVVTARFCRSGSRRTGTQLAAPD